MSRLDLLVGPNGAGKTTLFTEVIEPARPGLPFVNADRIAQQRWPDDAQVRSYEAAEIAAEVRRSLIEARLDFAAETVFSHESKVALVEQASAAGYQVVLHVVMVPLALSRARVQQRVSQGGHAVPDDKLGPRFERLWPLVVEAVPTCARAVFYDNSADQPRIVASFRQGVPDAPPQWPGWTPAPLQGTFNLGRVPRGAREVSPGEGDPSDATQPPSNG